MGEMTESMFYMPLFPLLTHVLDSICCPVCLRQAVCGTEGIVVEILDPNRIILPSNVLSNDADLCVCLHTHVQLNISVSSLTKNNGEEEYSQLMTPS